jgi:hypothetical protein
MAITYLNTNNVFIGAGHPTITDTKNAAGKYIDAQLLVGHTADGQHHERAKALCGEIYTFTGNGAARTLALQNVNLTPKSVEIWQDPTLANLVLNGGFDSSMASWSVTVGTAASVAGGQSGNCAQLTTSGTGVQIEQDIAVAVGCSYTLSVYIKSGSAGAVAVTLRCAGLGVDVTATSTGSWAQISGTGTALIATLNLKIFATFAAGTLLVDTCNLPNVYAAQYIRLSTFDSGKSCPRLLSGMVTTGIGNFAAGSVAIPAASGINTSGQTNYYVVLGTDTATVPTGDTGAGSDPAWISNGAGIAGDGIGGGAVNSCEKSIEDVFLHEHTDAGAHTANPYIGSGRIEQLTYLGNGADDRVITLQDPALVLKELTIIRDADTTFSRTVSVAGDNTKYEAEAALRANYIQALGTGQFTVGTAANVTGVTYHYLAVGVL